MTCVLKDQPGSWCLRVLQKYTPKEDDLTIFETHKEALAYLDKKYANPVAVSSKLIAGFVNEAAPPGKNDDQKLMAVYAQTMKLFSRLKAVHQESQLTQNMFVNKVIERLPHKFSDKFLEKRQRLDDTHAGAELDVSAMAMPEDIWKCLRSYLEDEQHIIQTYRPYNLTLTQDKPRSKRHQSQVNPRRLTSLRQPTVRRMLPLLMVSPAKRKLRPSK